MATEADTVKIDHHGDVLVVLKGHESRPLQVSSSCLRSASELFAAELVYLEDDDEEEISEEIHLECDKFDVAVSFFRILHYGFEDYSRTKLEHIQQIRNLAKKYECDGAITSSAQTYLSSSRSKWSPRALATAYVFDVADAFRELTKAAILSTRKNFRFIRAQSRMLLPHSLIGKGLIRSRPERN